MFLNPDYFHPKVLKRTSKGRILYVDDRCLIKSIGYCLYISSDRGISWEFIFSFPVGIKNRLEIRIPCLRRILRRGIHKLLKFRDNYVVFADNSVFYFNMKLMQCLNKHL